MFFKVGDRIVCIDASKNHPRIDIDFQQWIEEGNEYVVRATSLDLKGEQGILLNEVRNKPIFSTLLGGKFEPRFASIRFRKVEVQDFFVEKQVEKNVEEETYA